MLERLRRKLLPGLFVLASPFPAFAEDTIFSDDFQNFHASSPTGANAHWAVIKPAGDGEIGLLAEAPDGDGKRGVFLADNDSSDNSSLVGTFQDTSEMSATTFSCKVSLVAQPRDDYSAILQLRENFEPAVCLRFMGKSGRIELQQDENKWRPIASFEPGKPTRFEIVLNIHEKQCDVLVDGEMVAVGEPLASPVGGINRIAFATGIVSASQGDLTIENVEITSVE